ncbi:MAG TPA: EAL domain-containing protein, partial [Paracoccaceae bacterium]|nr:EAL domain-containing protein [Paracoccaceae bacterium]
ELNMILSPLDKDLARLASGARQFGDELNSLDQMRLRRLHFLYTGVAVGLILCGVALIALLSWNNRLLVRAHRKLRGVTDELEAVTDTLRLQNSRFQAALRNMTHGLCMFDARGELIVWNDRFREMFGFAHEAKPSMALLDDILAEAGTLPAWRSSEGASLPKPAAPVRARNSSFIHECPDGRFFAVQHVTLSDGGWLGTFEDITDRRRAEEQIVRMAHHDSLTGLANRTLFHDRLERALDTVNGSEWSLAVMFVDLDDFKDVNDTLGHQIGDEVLKAAAQRLRSCVREGDVIARLGGDEFGILLAPTREHTDYAEIATRLIESVGRPYFINGHEIIIGISIGIVPSEDESYNPEQLLRHADLALYDVKLSGGGSFRFFKPEMDEQLQDRKMLQADLRKALPNGELEVFYQPAIDSRSGAIRGFEALARWRHPTRGMIPPTRFIPIAEETGLIGNIGEWVLRQACTEAANWPAEINIAVNVSANQFRDRELVPKISEILASCNLPASRLELEITETVILEHNDKNLTTLHDLRDLGVRIAMDDFGTGYSSLRYLLGFPFDKIKIDKSFVDHISEDRESAEIVQLIVDLGNRLGIITAAEGIETERQFLHVQSTGCIELQGFYFAEAMPASQAAEYIQEKAQHSSIEDFASHRIEGVA